MLEKKTGSSSLRNKYLFYPTLAIFVHANIWFCLNIFRFSEFIVINISILYFFETVSIIPINYTYVQSS